MSYGTAPRKKQSGGLLFLIVIGIALFFMFGRGNSTQSPSTAEPDRKTDWSEPAVQRTEPGFTESNRNREKHPDSGDWNMEEVGSTKTQTKRNTTEPKSNRTDGGDWSIEEVDTNSKTEQPTFDVSKKSEQETPKSKSTKRGDWEIEEVDKKK